MQTHSFYLCHFSPANRMGPKDRSEDVFKRMHQVASTRKKIALGVDEEKADNPELAPQSALPEYP